MTVSREEFYNTRARLLKDMDKAVRDTVQTIEVFDMWLKYGVPDGADDAELREIAEDDRVWLGCVNIFAEVMNREVNNMMKFGLYFGAANTVVW